MKNGMKLDSKRARGRIEIQLFVPWRRWRRREIEDSYIDTVGCGCGYVRYEIYHFRFGKWNVVKSKLQERATKHIDLIELFPSFVRRVSSCTICHLKKCMPYYYLSIIEYLITAS